MAAIATGRAPSEPLLPRPARRQHSTLPRKSAVVAKRTSLEMVMEVAGYSGNAVEAARQVGAADLSWLI